MPNAPERLWGFPLSTFNWTAYSIRDRPDMVEYVRADLASTPNKPAEVDPEVLQALQFLTVGAEDSYDPDHVKVAAKMIKDALSGHLATGKGGGAAPTQIDAGDLELALSSLEPDDVDKAVIYAAARAHLSKLSGGDAQQSDMVAVPREVMEKVKDALANIPRYNKDGLMDFQTTEAWESARKALSMLQPYTKGE